MDINIPVTKYKIYIYGAGVEYNKLSSYLAAWKQRFEILGIVVSGIIERNKIDGYDVISIYNINNFNFDFIILASRKYWKEMLNECIAQGVEEEKIVRGSVFELPWFDIDEYIRLRESKVSIISNYCAGGLIYKELGLKVLSPTINMICEGNNFFDFLSDYKYYLEKEMVLYDDGYNDAFSYYLKNDYIRFMPKGIIDNKVVWNFAHEVNPEEEVLAWNIRRKRVNFKNIVVIMIIQNDEEALKFANLPIKRKIGFYYKDMGISSIVQIEGWEKQEIRRCAMYRWHVYANNCILNVKGKISKINWIRFLNGMGDFIRY